MAKAVLNRAGNIKVGNIATWSTLKGNEPIYIKQLDREIVGTCGKHCAGCTKNCYVNKSYRYNSVKYGHAIRTLALREDPEAVHENIKKQIERARNPFDIVRWNQSGEIETAADFKVLTDLGNDFPEVRYFIYTKAYEIVVPALLAGMVPENVTVLISIWHENGIEAYNKVKHLPNVKAFVYCDGFDYSAYGLQIDTMCNAYDETGKLNHNITCDKCTKCFNRSAKCKVIGCNDH